MLNETDNAYLTILQDADGSLEFQASYRNAHGTGYDLFVSAHSDQLVDILMFQAVCDELPEEPSISLSLPTEAAAAMLRALHGGMNLALQAKVRKQFN